MDKSCNQSSRRPYGGRKNLGVHFSIEILSKIASSPARRRRAFSSENDGFLCVKNRDIPDFQVICSSSFRGFAKGANSGGIRACPGGVPETRLARGGGYTNFLPRALCMVENK